MRERAAYRHIIGPIPMQGWVSQAVIYPTRVPTSNERHAQANRASYSTAATQNLTRPRAINTNIPAVRRRACEMRERNLDDADDRERCKME